MSKKVDKYIDEAITNIREDRKITRELLDDALKWLAIDESRHKEVGIVLSKYVETLQRSNEQLVKVVNLLNKKEVSDGLSDKDISNIYDLISKNPSEDKDA
tara:strand:- start:3778 stop:4080 length:303 start_codon:yes stop_codon:yes gene_type:complete